jgi:hypothetical protein
MLNKSAAYFREMELAAGGDFECDAEPFLKRPNSNHQKLSYTLIVRGYEWKIAFGDSFTVEPEGNEVLEFIRNMPDKGRIQKASPPPSK